MIVKSSVAVAMITQGENIPSTRFRLTQHATTLSSQGIEPAFFHSRYGAYPPARNWRRPAWLARSLIDAFQRAQRASKFDICVLQREMISTLATFETSIRCPIILDVDDAIFLQSRFGSVPMLARSASVIVCGNEFLADYFSDFGSVEVLPTGVDTCRFTPRAVWSESEQVIGWSGSSSGFGYLYEIESALVRILHEFPAAKIRIISDKAAVFSLLPEDRVEFRRWSPETEVADLQGFTVGLMPLKDGLWERGKCSFKMLTYMACGIPVVVSPVGMNVTVLAHAESGFAAHSINDWVDAVSFLLGNVSVARTMGARGRTVIEEFYSSDVVGRKLTQIIVGSL